MPTTFVKTRHDGLPSVINREDKKLIQFTRDTNRDRMVFTTKDKEQIKYLGGKGYAIDGNASGSDRYDNEKGGAASGDGENDYAVHKINEEGQPDGKALKLEDSLEAAQDWMTDNKIDPEVHSIFPRPRK